MKHLLLVNSPKRRMHRKHRRHRVRHHIRRNPPRRHRRRTAPVRQRRHRNPPAPVRHRRRRHHYARRGSGSRGFRIATGKLADLVSRETLTIAGGAVGSSILTGYVLRNFGAKLPGVNQTFGRIIYYLLIPFAGSLLVRRINPKLAQGMVIGGAVMGLNEIVATAATGGFFGKQVAAAGEYLDYAPVPSLQENVPNYSAVQQFGESIYDSTPAFRDPWNLREV